MLECCNANTIARNVAPCANCDMMNLYDCWSFCFDHAHVFFAAFVVDFMLLMNYLFRFVDSYN